MKKKQYIKPIVLFEDMDISDCILGVSQPGRTVIIPAASDVTINQNNNPAVSKEVLTDNNLIGSKESDWSYDYTFDLDW